MVGFPAVMVLDRLMVSLSDMLLCCWLGVIWRTWAQVFMQVLQSPKHLERMEGILPESFDGLESNSFCKKRLIRLAGRVYEWEVIKGRIKMGIMLEVASAMVMEKVIALGTRVRCDGGGGFG